jgi:hypothetical protein
VTLSVMRRHTSSRGASSPPVAPPLPNSILAPAGSPDLVISPYVVSSLAACAAAVRCRYQRARMCSRAHTSARHTRKQRTRYGATFEHNSKAAGWTAQLFQMLAHQLRGWSQNSGWLAIVLLSMLPSRTGQCACSVFTQSKQPTMCSLQCCTSVLHSWVCQATAVCSTPRLCQCT